MSGASFAAVLVVIGMGVVIGWRTLARRHILPCPPQFIWLLENRAMDRVRRERVADGSRRHPPGYGDP